MSKQSQSQRQHSTVAVPLTAPAAEAVSCISHDRARTKLPPFVAEVAVSQPGHTLPVIAEQCLRGSTAACDTPATPTARNVKRTP